MTNSRIAASLAFCCSLAMSLGAASQLTFRDSWKDAPSYNSESKTYGFSSTGSFSTSITLPLNGVDLSGANESSLVSLSIGLVGEPTPIIYGTLGDAFYAPGGNSATFPIYQWVYPYENPITAGNLQVTWTSAAITLSGSASFDALGEDTFYRANLSGGPAYSAINGFDEVYLVMSTPSGTFNYDNQNIPVSGGDRETDYYQPGTIFGYPPPQTLESGSISGAYVFKPPALNITSPASGFKVYDANTTIDLTGTTSDSALITNVECIVDGDTGSPIMIGQNPFAPAKSLDWTAKVDLSVLGHPGTNVLTVISQDESGNEASVSRDYIWVETNVVAVSVNPPAAGKVTGIKNGQILYVGQGYPISATVAGSNWLFSQWTDGAGDVLSSNATFDYFVESPTNTSNPALIGVFVPNPFTNSIFAGTYTGLYFDEQNSAQVSGIGYLTVSVTKTGAFSGKLYNAVFSGTSFPISGQLTESLDGSYATAALPPVKLSADQFAQVTLQIATDPNLADTGAGLMSGFVDCAGDIAEIQGELSHYNTNTVAGLYNVIIAPTDADPSQGPCGCSFVPTIVSDKKGSAGDVTMTLNLADDGSLAPITFSSALAQDGTCPFYASLYGGNGVVFGWMQFATDGSGTMGMSEAYWLTGPSYTGHVYPYGFGGSPAVGGGLYVPPKAGTNILVTTAPIFGIDPGYYGFNLPDEVDIPMTFNPSESTFTVSNKLNDLSIKLTPSSGAFSGTFTDPAGGQVCTYKGVVVNGTGWGYWIAPSKETGPIVINPPPNGGSDDGGGGGVIEIGLGFDATFTPFSLGPKK